MQNNEQLHATLGEMADLTELRLREIAPVLTDGLRSRALFGGLPLARVIPQDVHSVLDYVSGATLAASALCGGADVRAVGITLATMTTVTSLLTDYRLSVKKVVPIEVHETVDYVVGLSAIAAPFVFGYRKRSPLSAVLQVATGATLLLGALFTDYRARRGVTWGRRHEKFTSF